MTKVRFIDDLKISLSSLPCCFSFFPVYILLHPRASVKDFQKEWKFSSTESWSWKKKDCLMKMY